MFFSLKSIKNIAVSIIRRRHNPLYVQFYITSRCNLSCKQCNIIYANACVREASLDEIDQIAENLQKMNLGIILLTGGEPFIREDFADIVRAFESRGIHVRTQTNGLASREQMTAAVKAGARDISISLDSLNPDRQNFINGSYKDSWMRAIEAVSRVTEVYPARNSFASFGTVLSPYNFLEIPNIIRFATAIGWHVSLVPAHITDQAHVFNFRSYDQEMIFPSSIYAQVNQVLDECLALKKQGYSLYDAEEYIENIRKFITGQTLSWRRKNHGLCDSPFLYFGIRPNGDFCVCCDHNLPLNYPVWHPDFIRHYQSGEIWEACKPYVESCSGCMYGSYPEISITAHYPAAFFDRLKIFTKTPIKKPWPVKVDTLMEIIDDINAAYPLPKDSLTQNIPFHN